MSDITKLLHDWTDGDAEALDDLMALVFEELRTIASRSLNRESRAHTLQPTALVNEVYLKLVDRRSVDWQNRAQFFGFAAELMRRILVDHARARKTSKRGGDVRKISLDASSLDIADHRDLDLVALDDALKALAELDERQSRVVEMRFFAGLKHEEIAQVLGVSPTTVKREWQTARLWLRRALREG
ncbi:MAG: sigma-70 family RNA polymerase sigma factor [Acidobacteriota bacterium]